MDILLTHGYFLLEDDAEKKVMKPYPTLGILYISAYLKQNGFTPKIFDTTFSSFLEFQNFILQKKPSIVGIYSNLMTKFNVIKQIKFCKKNNCKIIVGGPDVPNYSENYISIGADICVLGEGEEVLKNLIPEIQKSGVHKLHNVNGIVFQDEFGNIVKTQPQNLVFDLDTIPFPDRDAIDIRRYMQTWKTYHKESSISLICSRGCPFSCSWCSRTIFGETQRRRSVENVISEIEMIKEKYSPDMLWFADDVFTINHKWFNDFYSSMMNKKMAIPFECISRADRLSEDILKKMKELGSFRIWFGAESGSQKILDAMQRKVTVEQITIQTKIAQKYGIEIGFFIMIGYPNEKILDIERTVEMLKKASPNTFLTTVAYPIKGTPFYEEVEDKIYTQEENWEENSDRNLKFKRDYSEKFYRFANSYVLNEVENYKLQYTKNYKKRFSAYSKAKISKIMMNLFSGEV